jgi:hypothetical protein
MKTREGRLYRLGFIQISYQNTYNGLSVARFSLHSNLSVDPSFICKSGASIISATASVEQTAKGNEKRDVTGDTTTMQS